MLLYMGSLYTTYIAMSELAIRVAIRLSIIFMSGGKVGMTINSYINIGDE